MSKLKFTLRLLGTYYLVAIVGGVVVTMLDISPGQTLNVLAILVSCLYNCKAYARANGSYFTRADKIKIAATAGVVQAVLLSITGSQGAPPEVTQEAIIGVAILLGMVHVFVVYLMLSMTRKVLVKQQLLPAV